MINHKEEYPLFTVIIPQKNRAEYLQYTLRTCMIQDYPNLEFIVSDDCSDDNSVEIVQQLMKEDSRIKLIEHKCHVGMRENFEIALNSVRPGYVMALGGDDGLVPGCFWKMYEIIKETGTALLTWKMHIYRYPDNGRTARFLVPKKQFDGYRFIKSTDFLNKISKSFKYLIDECPMFYVKGVASTDLVYRVKSRTPDGSFYYCPTPDGFSGVVLAGEVETFVYTCEPLSINGSTPKSQGLNYKRTDEQSRRESEQFFNDNVRRVMHRELASQPYSPLVTLMTADYLLTAKDLPGWPGKVGELDFEELIKKTFKMLERNPFANEVLVRELKILKEIAIQHDCLDLFNSLCKKTKRKLTPHAPFRRFVTTKTMFQFEASELNIHNIYDASLASCFAYNLCNINGFKWTTGWIISSIQAYLNRFNYQRISLPNL